MEVGMKRQMYVKRRRDVGTWVIIIVCWAIVWGAWFVATTLRGA